LGRRNSGLKFSVEKRQFLLQRHASLSDDIIVTSCFLRFCLRQLFLTAVLMGVAGAAEVSAVSGKPPLVVAARETGPDAGIAEVLALRLRAERGDIVAQVALAEFFHGRKQHTEAVYWYRCAATNGEVTAQLALAGCLIAGTGIPENRKEAAHWMRQAAVGIERGGIEVERSPNLPAKTSQPAAPPPRIAATGSAPIILTRSNSVTVSSSSLGASEKNLFTNRDSHSTRVTRDDNLSVVEPKLQERSLGLQPAATPK
jgi:hypothetical protein